MINSASVSKDGRKAGTRGHPSRRGEDAAPQDEVGDIFKVLNPHGEERGKAARLEPSGREWTRGHPSRRGEGAAPQDEVGDIFTASQDEVGDMFTAGERGDPYAAASRLRAGVRRLASRLTWVAMGPGSEAGTTLVLARAELCRCPGLPQSLRNAQHRDVPARCRIKGMAQQRWRAPVRARCILHVMAIEDQPAAFGDGFVECAIDSIAVDMQLDQGRGAQVLQVHDAAVDAGKNAAR